MKKILVFFIALIAMANLSYAQWNTASGTNNIYYNLGNVGIGNTNPTFGMLEISGNSTTNPAVAAVTPGLAQGEVTDLSLWSTFQNTGDNGPRRTADITAGFSGGSWGYEYLAFNVGDNGNTNDVHALTSEKMRITTNGYVGIANTNPLDRFDITGTSSGNAGRVMIGDGGNINPYMRFYRWTGTGSLYFQVSIVDGVDAQGAMSFQTGGGGAAIGSDAQTTRMIITQPGNVGIGTINPGSYKLAVEGNIHSQAVQVDMNGWSDYVFESSYQLPTLTSVKNYIDQNHHLPDMPSAADVEKNGINVGETEKLLTKKVEELTLYLIEKDKENNELKERLKEQDDRIAKLEAAVEKLLN
jgi:hypothetical protein